MDGWVNIWMDVWIGIWYMSDLMESAELESASGSSEALNIDYSVVLTWRESNGERMDRNLWHSYMNYLNVWLALEVTLVAHT